LFSFIRFESLRVRPDTVLEHRVEHRA
jgi:hypothetical protein